MTPIELHRPVVADRLGDAATVVEVVADVQECAAVAARLMLPAIAALRCRWTLRRGQQGAVSAEGLLHATVTQTCAISLDPFEAAVTEPFAVQFVVAGREAEGDDPDEPDQLPYDGAMIDLGEATVEQLALVLDPYPRRPGAALDTQDGSFAGGAFAGLAKLRPLD